MSYKVVKLVLKKHQVFNKYKSRKHPAYVKAARDAHTEMQRAKRNFVTSGVPQGSVLGPILFFIFINDLDSGLVSSVFKFADDTKLVGNANSTQDSILLQRNLQQLIEWSDMWLIPFNKSKCIVMHLLITAKTSSF